MQLFVVNAPPPPPQYPHPKQYQVCISYETIAFVQRC